MKTRIIILVIASIILLGAAGASFYYFKIQKPAQIQAQLDKEELKRKAKVLYDVSQRQNLDFTKGPCLGHINDDWVVDLVHQPRNSDDEVPENQCTSFLMGQAHHFIELDLNGNFVWME